jgi:anti-repressor protein
MNELIHIQTTQIGAENVNSVNSRDIYEYLEVNTKYADWIKRAIEKYDFVENEDFTILKNGNGSNAFLDYIVTLDMAKELCMVSNTAKGKETRKYFIKAEKQSQKVLSVSEQIQLIAQGNQIIDERLTVLEKTKKLEYWQERALHDVKNQTVYRIANGDEALAKRLHLRVWSLFKKQFHLPRYNELPAIKFEDGKSYILNLSLADMV